jgi:hypothetical protein
MKRIRLQSELSQPTTDKKHVELLKADGPSLANFRVYGQESPFSKIVVKKSHLNEFSREIQPLDIRLHSDRNANLRAFYYLLLTSCFSTHTPQLTVSSPTACKRRGGLIERFKQFVFDDHTDLEKLGKQLPDSTPQRILSSNRLMKKVIADVLHLLSNNHSEDVVSLVSKYPIVDVLMMLVIRAVVLNHHSKTNLSQVDIKVDTDIIVDSLRE